MQGERDRSACPGHVQTPGDLRACLRQLHQLPVPILGYLPLWLETLRAWLAADGVVALWTQACVDQGEGASDARTEATCWYAPQASLSACEQLAASGRAMPRVAALQRALSHGSVLRNHARRLPGERRHAASMSLCRSPELERCLPDGDLLDVCLRPLPGEARQAAETGEQGRAPSTTDTSDFGTLRLLVSRRSAKPRFNAREVKAFETAALAFATPLERPCFPPLCASPLSLSLAFSSPVSTFTSADACRRADTSLAIGHDVTGTLIWHGRQPEWADPTALALMRRVWHVAPGRAWPDACAVVRSCQSLADELMSPSSSTAGSGAQVSRAMPVPGGTLHLHATHLCGMGGRPTDRVRIALHLAVPPAIRLLQRLCETPLTPVQREIAMRLLAGQSRAQTREACAIGVQTLKTHLSLMRARLDPVRDAALLLGLGRTGTAGTTGHL